MARPIQVRAGFARAFTYLGLLAHAAGCSGPVRDDILIANVAAPSITISFPEGRSQFPIDTDIPLNVVVKEPVGQGIPQLVARIMKGDTIANEAGPGEPTTTTEDERTYLVNFKKGVPRAGKYQVVVKGIMTLPGPHPATFPKSERESRIHRFDSNAIPLEVIK